LLRWSATQARLDGFIYLPLIEASFGIFLILTAIAVPLLFLKYNGVQIGQYPEWLFCLGFLLFFLWMGKTLAYQYFDVKITDNKLRIVHNLRGPDMNFERPVKEWIETRLADAKDQEGKTYKTIVIYTTDGGTEVYRTVNNSEAETILNAFEELRKNIGG